MTGDRRLKDHEKEMFIRQRFLGIEVIRDAFYQGGEPSLYDAAFLEILGSLDAHTNLIIDLGSKIRLLEKRLGLLENE